MCLVAFRSLFICAPIFCVSVSQSHATMDVDAAALVVAEHRRSAAGDDELPTTSLRPPITLLLSVNYLMQCVCGVYVSVPLHESA